MVKQVIRYEAEDGTMFFSESAARHHEITLGVAKILTERLEQAALPERLSKGMIGDVAAVLVSYGFDNGFDKPAFEEIFNFLVSKKVIKNAPVSLKIFQGFSV